MPITINTHTVSLIETDLSQSQLPNNLLTHPAKIHISQLQTDLLTHPAKIRIATAPTGAGKSYAFQCAMLKGDRILFIIPTRRLAQNLRESLLQFLTSSEIGWEAEKAKNKVAVWSSDETQRLEDDGEIKKGQITGRRIREIYELDDTREGGEMVFAIPEAVSNILLRKTLAQGQAETGVFDLLTQFDHIVFDEFHTIEARGFGMAALFAKLVSEFPHCRAKVSFLSATPLDIEPVLLSLKIPEPEEKYMFKIAKLKEVINTGADIKSKDRVVHGDVQLSFEKCESMATLIQNHADRIKTETDNAKQEDGKYDNQVVIIYNNLDHIQFQVPEVAKLLQNIGVIREQRLLINSIDDSGIGEAERREFITGRDKNPEQFKVLMATSSIEMGVTFQTRLLLMDPGFEPLNFLQRYGRAARGFPGAVIVRWDDTLKDKMSWLNRLLKWVDKNAGKTCEIHQLENELKRFVIRRFEYDEEELDDYGHLPNDAKWIAGLYWHFLHKQQCQQKMNQHLEKHLFDKSPPLAHRIREKLGKVRQMGHEPLFAKSAKRWCDLFEAQVRILRNIERRIKVVNEQTGNYRMFPEGFLLRKTTILEQGFWTIGKDGSEEVHVPKAFDAYYEDKNSYEPPKPKSVYLPHKDKETISAKDCRSDADLIKAWCRHLYDKTGTGTQAWQRYEESMQAAEKLVKWTGLVVSEYDDSEMDTSIGVFG